MISEYRIFSFDPLPRDNGYLLMAALSHTDARVHNAPGKHIQIAPLTGTTCGQEIFLNENSRLHIRGIDEDVALSLQGKSFKINRFGRDTFVHIDKLSRIPFRPSRSLFSSATVLDEATQPNQFREKAAVELSNVLGRSCPTFHVGPGHGIRVRKVFWTAFALTVDGLSSEESVFLQERGFGLKRSMGAGVFFPCP